jgi:L-asparaginase II
MAEIVQTRGSCIESRHPFHAVGVCDGEVVFRWGDPGIVTTWRSAAKPFQLAASLEVLGDPPVAEAELAVGAASHSGEPMHVAVVRGLLERLGVPESGLRCGTHPPVHEPSARAILRAGDDFTDIHNNCSGKHTFMLAAALAQRWDADYRPPTHPLQQHILRRVARWAGETPTTALDGCGVPTFCLSLTGIARAWSQVAAGDDTRLGEIGRAMAARPDLTSGTGRLDQAVVHLAREPMAVKIGAQGVFCLALPGRRLGLAIKVESGQSDALGAAVAAVLGRAAPGSWPEAAAWPFNEVRNVAGDLAGAWRVAE